MSDANSVLSAISLARDLGAYGVLALALVGGARGWYVWRWTHDKMLAQVIEERDEWKSYAKRGLLISERVVVKP